MPRNNDETSLVKKVSLDELIENFQSDSCKLFDTPDPSQIVEDVIVRVRQFATEYEKFPERNTFDSLADRIRETVQRELIILLPNFLSDKHREFIVKCHAQGLTTAGAVLELAQTETVIERLAKSDAIGWEKLRSNLIHRFSYLKPGNPRWSEKKYGEVWREARAVHQASIVDMPLSSRPEQIKVLSESVNRIVTMLDKGCSTKEFVQLTRALTYTIESLRKLTEASPPQEQPVPSKLSGPQLLAVLERVTLTLENPRQLTVVNEKEGIINILEQLLSTLQNGAPKALAGEASGEVRVAKVVPIGSNP